MECRMNDSNELQVDMDDVFLEADPQRRHIKIFETSRVFRIPTYSLQTLMSVCFQFWSVGWLNSSSRRSFGPS